MSLKRLKGSHDSVAIAAHCLRELEKFKISGENIISATTDGGSNFRAAARKVCKFDVRCIAHLLNLALHDGEKLAKDAVLAMRKFVSFVRNTSLVREAVEEASESCPFSVPLEHNSTRWASTFQQLRSVLCLEGVFAYLNRSILSEDGVALRVELMSSLDVLAGIGAVAVRVLKVLRVLESGRRMISSAVLHELIALRGSLTNFCETVLERSVDAEDVRHEPDELDFDEDFAPVAESDADSDCEFASELGEAEAEEKVVDIDALEAVRATSRPRLVESGASSSFCSTSTNLTRAARPFFSEEQFDAYLIHKVPSDRVKDLLRRVVVAVLRRLRFVDNFEAYSPFVASALVDPVHFQLNSCDDIVLAKSIAARGTKTLLSMLPREAESEVLADVADDRDVLLDDDLPKAPSHKDLVLAQLGEVRKFFIKHKVCCEEPELQDGDRDTRTLDWWKENSKTYPLLAPYVKDLFTLQPTSCESERMFSAAGRVLTQRRATLHATRLEQLCLVKHNIRMSTDLSSWELA